MMRPSWMGSILLFSTLLACSSLFASEGVPEAPDLNTGKALYERLCQRCHGADGSGNGPQAPYQMLPPTDFHTSKSRRKSDEQLLQIIKRGVFYSPMHAWRDDLSEQEMKAVLAYVRMLSQ